jgi:energy-coupling factor transporter ATP-binding protein EcfA2
MTIATAPMRATPPLASAGVGEVAPGLPDVLIVDLVLRHLLRAGDSLLVDLSRRMGLSRLRMDALLKHVRALNLVKVSRCGDVEGDVSFVLTDLGRMQARVAVDKCQYVGPAPVTLDEYVGMVHRQSMGLQATTALQLKAAMGDLVLDEDLLSNLGSALNSGKAIYLHGPSGSGKTYLAEHLVKTLRGQIWIPHAIQVDGEIIQVFDQRVHRVVKPSETERLSLSRNVALDGRWILTERPIVMTGGELTLRMLELEFDPVSRIYVAPPQMKANNGIFVVDDLGRQRVSPHELLNRWIFPLDRHVDYLGLHTGAKFQIPFDVMVIFSSNLTPDELTDPAFARRLGYKIPIKALSSMAYRVVVAQACMRIGAEFDQRAVDHLVEHLHPSHRQDYLPCIPYDVISKIRDRARYLGQELHLTPELMEWAWQMYFGPDNTARMQLARSSETEKERK